MFDAGLFSVNANKIHLDIDELRARLDHVLRTDYRNEDYSALIAKFTEVNDHVLLSEKHAKLSYSMSLESVGLEDAKYIKFCCDINDVLNEKYRKNTMKIRFFKCHDIVKILYPLVKVFLDEKTISKLKFHFNA